MPKPRRRPLRTSLEPASALLALLLAAAAHAWAPPAAEAQDAALPLWEVSHQGNTVYLLGSVHMLRPEVYPLDDAIYEAFERAEVVAFELDMGELMAAAAVMVQRGTYQDGRSLRQTVPADVFEALESSLGGLGLPIQAVQIMKPWMVALTLSSLAIQQAGFDAASGIDMHFFERTQAAGKRLTALETVEDQIEVFDGLDDAHQVAFLRATLDELETAAERLDELTELWRRGEAERLAAYMIESLEGQPVLLERILYERNRNWVPGIEALIRGAEPALVIVGMGHLVGEGSVIELLEAHGYEVVQIRAGRAVGAGAR